MIFFAWKFMVNPCFPLNIELWKREKVSTKYPNFHSPWLSHTSPNSWPYRPEIVQARNSEFGQPLPGSQPDSQRGKRGRSQRWDRLFLMGSLPAGSDLTPQSHLFQGASLQFLTRCDEGKAVLFPGCWRYWCSSEGVKGRDRWKGPRAAGRTRADGSGLDRWEGLQARWAVPKQLEPR